MPEKPEFLIGLLDRAGKMHVMSMAYIGDDPVIGLYDLFQFFHLARLGNPRFKNCKLVFLFHLPHRKRNPYLGIV